MGFDPILSMPGIDGFKKDVVKRSCPIKSLLLNQSFSAGIGNWVAGMSTHEVDEPIFSRSIFGTR